MAAKIRLYVEHDLAQGQSVDLSRDQTHYLFGVMRLGVGDSVLAFNGRQGEWLATVAEAGKRGGTLTIAEQTRPQADPPDLWLLFAPIKKARTDFIVEKAVELGVARIQPVMTEFTNSERVRQDRLQAHAVEAAEQCGATHLPEVAEAARLERLLADWPADRALIFCDEGAAGTPAGLDGLAPGPAAVLIGPEGGFSDTERARLARLPFARTLSLGPRILRADTAAVAALVLWQARLGDWR
ncbi:16S rRNA (uracil(1498)-N(3))-methyltransferase [Seohaeicola nanhaiensis]|uniref:Ribosomal RNA small subunit methyltransferase E n=1 Tax=Seohaeicola nanhaiensis TaxID=1387282 RepID=A0ABV9KE04_9RHOB